MIRECAAAMILAVTVPRTVADEFAPELHFKPSGHALGDVHPFFHGGVCYLYYLKPGKYESALACSRDLLRWTETALRHGPVGDGDRMAPYFVLGVFRDEAAGVYRSFYGHAAGRMVSSESRDLLHWSCGPKEFQVPPAGYYLRRRDPFVYWIPETREYGCVMTTKLQGRPDHQAGAVSLAKSADLRQWRDLGPILDPGDIGEPECPQVFRLGSFWYLLASIYDRAVGRPVYWTSQAPAGGWAKQRPRPLDGKDLCAAQVAFDEGIPMLFGWIPLKPSKPGNQTWGGHLALPREIHASGDGTLGVRLPKKLREAFARLAWQTHLASEIGDSPRFVPGEWESVALECSVHLPNRGQELRIGFSPLGGVSIQHSKLRLLDVGGEVWSDLEVDLPRDRCFAVQLFLEGDIAEVFVDDRYALAARLPRCDKPRRLSFEARPGSASIASPRTCAWALPR